MSFQEDIYDYVNCKIDKSNAPDNIKEKLHNALDGAFQKCNFVNYVNRGGVN